jgi:2-dehydro-3-deoxyphosphogluconate aldolase/(4S)-4-hydroxy-2-oxoglutarate aldolase
MTNYARLNVLNRITASGLIPIFYHPVLDSAQAILDACVKGGATVVEFTNRGDRAWQLFSALAENSQENTSAFILGAGSVVDVATAALYINNGAGFIVGPTFNPRIAELCNRRKVAYIPGCATLTEISNAEAAGVELVKIFPGDVLGPKFVKAVLGPQPWTKMVITGGVVPEESNIKAWFQAGATAVGIGSKLIRSDWVKAGQFHKITEIVSQTLKWIKTNSTGQ